MCLNSHFIDIWQCVRHIRISLTVYVMVMVIWIFEYVSDTIPCHQKLPYHLCNGNGTGTGNGIGNGDVQIWICARHLLLNKVMSDTIPFHQNLHPSSWWNLWRACFLADQTYCSGTLFWNKQMLLFLACLLACFCLKFKTRRLNQCVTQQQTKLFINNSTNKKLSCKIGSNVNLGYLPILQKGQKICME